MNTRILYLLAGLALLVKTTAFAFAPIPLEKLYVAVEGEGTVAVFDTASRKRIATVLLGTGGSSQVAPHNVQVAPDGRSVWVTVNSEDHHGHAKSGDKPQGSAHEAASGQAIDEVVVINPETDVIERRIPLGTGLHLAHVALAPDSLSAYVTAQNTGTIYKIDAKTFKVQKLIAAPSNSQPHGLRIAGDGSHAYIALLNGKGLGKLNLQTDKLEVLALAGAAVQTAVTPNSRIVAVSLYDSKQLAIYDTNSGALHNIPLPNNAKGPVQLYPTPDNRYLYVADQGHYFNQPDGQWIYKVDLQQGKVIRTIKAGNAPHGIVIAKNGRYAYVSNLVSNDVSIIDLKTDEEIARLPVGQAPNGISIWNKHEGGTP